MSLSLPLHQLLLQCSRSLISCVHTPTNIINQQRCSIVIITIVIMIIISLSSCQCKWVSLTDSDKHVGKHTQQVCSTCTASSSTALQLLLLLLLLLFLLVDDALLRASLSDCLSSIQMGELLKLAYLTFDLCFRLSPDADDDDAQLTLGAY